MTHMIYILGAPGSGKTTLGKLFQTYGLQMVSVDALSVKHPKPNNEHGHDLPTAFFRLLELGPQDRIIVVEGIVDNWRSVLRQNTIGAVCFIIGDPHAIAEQAVLRDKREGRKEILPYDLYYTWAESLNRHFLEIVNEKALMNYRPAVVFEVGEKVTEWANKAQEVLKLCHSATQK